MLTLNTKQPFWKLPDLKPPIPDTCKLIIVGNKNIRDIYFNIPEKLVYLVDVYMDNYVVNSHTVFNLRKDSIFNGILEEILKLGFTKEEFGV